MSNDDEFLLDEYELQGKRNDPGEVEIEGIPPDIKFDITKGRLPTLGIFRKKPISDVAWKKVRDEKVLYFLYRNGVRSFFKGFQPGLDLDLAVQGDVITGTKRRGVF